MKEEETGKDSWSSWRRHIILELERLNDNFEKIEKRHSEYILSTSVELGRLKVWSIVYGLIGGGAMTLIFKGIINKLW